MLAVQVSNLEEHRRVNFAQMLLTMLGQYEADFEAAIEIIDAAIDHKTSLDALRTRHGGIDAPFPIIEARVEEMGRLTRWFRVAARDGAMSVFHFGKALNALRSCSRDLPALSRQVDHAQLRESWRAFLRTFPSWEILRHAIAHRADNLGSYERFLSIAPEGRPFIGEHISLSARSITYHHRPQPKQSDKIMTLAITRATLRNIEEVRVDAFRAFENLAFCG